MARGRRRRGRDASNAKMVGGKKKKKKGLSHAALPLGSTGERAFLGSPPREEGYVTFFRKNKKGPEEEEESGKS